MKRIDEEKAEIKRMRVSKQYQRRGIGKTILNLLEESARSKGYTRLILDTTVNQIPAQRLYENKGYVEYKRGNSGIETIYYVKHLWEKHANKLEKA